MKLSIIRLLFLLASVWLSSSCQKEVTEIALPDEPAKLVVTSFISPADTLIRVAVSKTITTAEIDTFSIKKQVIDATVTLSDGTNEAVLSHLSEGEYGVRAELFPIVEGRSYHLQVSTPQGEQVESFCKVPLAQNHQLEAIIDSVRNETYLTYELTFKWQDIAGEQHYYGCSAYLINYMANGVSQQVIDWQQTSPFITDFRGDGGQLISPKGVFSVILRREAQNPVYKREISALLYTTDSHYYKYHQALYSYDDANPFTEPSPIYSNIYGGLGVFASYTQQALLIELK